MKPGAKRRAKDAERKMVRTSEREDRRKHLTGRLQAAETKLCSPYVQGHAMKKLRLQARVRDYREQLAALDPRPESPKTIVVSDSVIRRP